MPPHQGHIGMRPVPTVAHPGSLPAYRASEELHHGDLGLKLLPETAERFQTGRGRLRFGVGDLAVQIGQRSGVTGHSRFSCGDELSEFGRRLIDGSRAAVFASPRFEGFE